MAIERWELLLSSKEDRYLLKLRGDKADVDRLVRAHSNVCHEPQPIGDPVYQWVIFVVGASFAERLAIQNQIIAMSSAQLQSAGRTPAGGDLSANLSNVLNELSSVLEELTGLTAEEEAHVLKKMQQIHQREANFQARAAAAPAARPPAPPPSRPPSPYSPPAAP